MPEYLRSFISIFFIGISYLFLVKGNYRSFLAERDYNKWLLTAFMVISSGFIIPNYWIFIGLLLLITLTIQKQHNQRVVYFLLLIPLLPELTKEIQGFGEVRLLFVLSYPRALIIFLLLPALIGLLNDKKTVRLFSMPSDKFIVLYVLLNFFHEFRDNTLTNSFRECFYYVVDIFIPYYVISRALRDFSDYKKAQFAFLFSIVFIALIGVVETAKGWHLFAAMADHMLDEIASFTYAKREGMLRSYATFSGPIAFGYMVVIGIGTLFTVKDYLKNKSFLIIMMILLLCLITTFSRGPWLGGLLLAVLIIVTGEQKIRSFIFGVMLLLLLLSVLSMIPFGDKILRILPFIGEGNTHASTTIEYRKELLITSWEVIKQNPMIGSTTYLESPEMEAMRQGQNIIDIVNSYILITLKNGFVGLSLFIMFFGTLLYRLFIEIRRLGSEQYNLYVFSRGLFATIGAVLLIIGTTSSIGRVPLMYWSLGGIVAGYLHFVKNKVSDKDNYSAFRDVHVT